jgi:hypothetical protein
MICSPSAKTGSGLPRIGVERAAQSVLTNFRLSRAAAEAQAAPSGPPIPLHVATPFGGSTGEAHQMEVTSSASWLPVVFRTRPPPERLWTSGKFAGKRSRPPFQRAAQEMHARG